MRRTCVFKTCLGPDPFIPFPLDEGALLDALNLMARWNRWHGRFFGLTITSEFMVRCLASVPRGKPRAVSQKVDSYLPGKAEPLSKSEGSPMNCNSPLWSGQRLHTTSQSATDTLITTYRMYQKDMAWSLNHLWPHLKPEAFLITQEMAWRSIYKRSMCCL